MSFILLLYYILIQLNKLFIGFELLKKDYPILKIIPWSLGVVISIYIEHMLFQ